MKKKVPTQIRRTIMPRNAPKAHNIGGIEMSRTVANLSKMSTNTMNSSSILVPLQ